MLKISTINQQRFAEFLSYILCIFLIILMSGCSDESFYTNQIPTATITSPEDGGAYTAHIMRAIVLLSRAQDQTLKTEP